MNMNVNLMNTMGYLQSTNNPPVGRVPALEDLQMARLCVAKFWVKIQIFFFFYILVNYNSLIM